MCEGCWARWAHPQRRRELCSRVRALPVRSTALASAATGHMKGPGRAGCWKWLGFLWKMNWRHYCCLFWHPGSFAEGKKCIWNSKVTISKIIWTLSPSQMCPVMWFDRSLYPVCLFYILKFCRFVFTDSNVIVVIWTRCIVSSAPSAPANATTALWARLIFEVKDDDISYFKWLSLSQLKCRAVLDGIRLQLEELLAENTTWPLHLHTVAVSKTSRALYVQRNVSSSSSSSTRWFTSPRCFPHMLCSSHVMSSAF